MDGNSMEVGAVSSLRHVRHAISTARLVMERTTHTMLAGLQVGRADGPLLRAGGRRAGWLAGWLGGWVEMRDLRTRKGGLQAGRDVGPLLLGRLAVWVFWLWALHSMKAGLQIGRQ